MDYENTKLKNLRSEKAKAEQKLRSCQHREKILERQMSELNRRERVHRLCTRAGMLESFLVCPGELTDDQVMELLKISFRQPEVVLALAKMVHDVHERSSIHTRARPYLERVLSIINPAAMSDTPLNTWEIAMIMPIMAADTWATSV